MEPLNQTTNQVLAPPPTVTIPEAHRVAADRYIAAILRRDPLAPILGDGYVDERTANLWKAFADHYAEVAIGPYARHGADALQIALGKI